RDGALQEVARKGDPAVGVPGTLADIPEFVSQFAGLNSRGDLAFSLRTETSGSDFRPSSIWLLPGDQPPTGMAPIVRPGQSIGAALPGASIVSGEFEGINDAGQIALRALLEGPGIGPTNNEALMTVKDGQFQILAREGDAIPGTSWTIEPRTLANAT